MVKDLRISAIGNNLFFFKKDAPFDPEQAAGVNAGGVGIDAFDRLLIEAMVSVLSALFNSC